MLIALKIEQQLSKDRILELYLNEIYLGQHAYGFAAAAQVYFGKPLDKLTIAEVAMLAGLPQNPLYANPVTNLKRATQRQRIVLHACAPPASSTSGNCRGAEPLTLRSPLQVPLHAEHVAEMARRAVVERFGTEAYSSGIRVQTSLRAQDQQWAWNALRHAVLEHDRKGVWRGPEDREALADRRRPRGGTRGGAGAEGPPRRRVAAHRHRAAGYAASRSAVQLASGQRVTVTGHGLKWVKAALSPKAKAAVALRRGAVVRVMQQGKAWVFAQWPQAQGLCGAGPGQRPGAGAGRRL